MDHSSQAQAAQPAATYGAWAAVPVGEAGDIVLSKLVSEVYGESEPSLRARLLECLLRPVGPVRSLRLVAVAAGTFSRILHGERRSRARRLRRSWVG